MGLEFAAQTRSQIAISVEVVLAVRTHCRFGENFVGRARVAIVLGIVDKVLSAKEAAVGIVRGLSLGHIRQNTGSFASQHWRGAPDWKKDYANADRLAPEELARLRAEAARLTAKDIRLNTLNPSSANRA
jgi:hypothetical protein